MINDLWLILENVSPGRILMKKDKNSINIVCLFQGSYTFIYLFIVICTRQVYKHYLRNPITFLYEYWITLKKNTPLLNIP